jgi:hypothetical protein
MSVSLLAFQWTDLGFGISLAVALAAVLLVPYLIFEIRRGKQRSHRSSGHRKTLGLPWALSVVEGD